MKKRKNNREKSSVRIPLFGWKIGTERFLIFFVVMIAALLAVSQLLYSFYVQLSNDGTITDLQALSLGGATLASVIGVTVFVGARYISRLKKLNRSKLFKR